MEDNIKDSLLLKIALITSFLGLLTLFIIMFFSVIPEKDIDSINDSDIGNKILVKGFIDKISYSQNNKTTFISLAQKCSMDIVSFNHISIANGSYVAVEGVVQDNKGQLEFIADKITKQ